MQLGTLHATESRYCGRTVEIKICSRNYVTPHFVWLTGCEWLWCQCTLCQSIVCCCYHETDNSHKTANDHAIIMTHIPVCCWNSPRIFQPHGSRDLRFLIIIVWSFTMSRQIRHSDFVPSIPRFFREHVRVSCTGVRMRTSRSRAWVSCIHASILCCILASTYVVLYTRRSMLYKRSGTFPLVHTSQDILIKFCALLPGINIMSKTVVVFGASGTIGQGFIKVTLEKGNHSSTISFNILHTKH